jgi:SEC-C motif-containing protein
MNKKLKISNKKNEDTCPCQQYIANIAYENCCGRWHTVENYLKAPTAEHLMCSRYSAFVLKLEQYLLDTWHVSKRPQSLDFTNDNTKWLGLNILNTFQQDEAHATVEFIAKSKINGKSCNIHENSRFILENGIWVYVEGIR